MSDVLYKAPLETVEASYRASSPGATVYVRVVDTPSGATFIARTTTGVVNNPAGSRLFYYSFTAPASAGTWSIQWDEGDSTNPLDSDVLVIGSTTVAISLGGARSTMGGLIARVRSEINDPSGASQVFSDADLQDSLDDNATYVRYASLSSVRTIAPGGARTYLIWEAPCGFWESDAQLTDSRYNVLTTTAQDYLRGRWTLQTSTTGPVLIVGQAYDLYAAAADVVGMWIAKVKLDFDFTADATSVSRSQKAAMLRQLRDDLLMKAGNVFTAQQDAGLIRSDDVLGC